MHTRTVRERERETKRETDRERERERERERDTHTQGSELLLPLPEEEEVVQETGGRSNTVVVFEEVDMLLDEDKGFVALKS